MILTEAEIRAALKFAPIDPIDLGRAIEAKVLEKLKIETKGQTSAAVKRETKQ